VAVSLNNHSTQWKNNILVAKEFFFVGMNFRNAFLACSRAIGVLSIFQKACPCLYDHIIIASANIIIAAAAEEKEI